MGQRRRANPRLNLRRSVFPQDPLPRLSLTLFFTRFQQTPYENPATRAQLSALSSQIRERDAWVSTLESALSTQRDNAASIQAEIKVERYQHQAVKKEVERLRERVKVQQDMIAALFERVKDARASNGWKNEAERLSRKSAGLEKALREAKGDADQARTEKMAVERTAGRWIEEWTGARKEVEEGLKKEVEVSRGCVRRGEEWG